MKRKIVLMELLDTDTGIDWWDANRSKLNDVINSFNDWQTKHKFDSWEMEVVKAKIELCRKCGQTHTFSDWQYELLDEMEDYIRQYQRELEWL